jgi:outer membrane protein TolC
MALLCLLLLATKSPADPITLEQAVAKGLKNNFNIQMSRNTDQIAQNNKLLGVGGLLPVATATGYIGKSLADSGIKLPTGIGGDTKTTSKSAQLNLSWTLFDGFKMFYAYSSLNEAAELSRLQTRDKIERAVVDIIQAYFNVVTQQALWEAAQQQIEVSEDRLKRIEARRELGGSTEIEYLNAKVALNADRSLLQSRNIAKIMAENMLNLTLGRPHGEGFTVTDEVPLHEVSGTKEDWQKQVKLNNALMTVQHKLRRLEELDLAIQRANYWPVIAATGSYGISSTDIDPPSTFRSGGDESSLSFGISATWPLLTGFRTRTAVKNSKLNLKNAVISQKQYELQLEALVYQQWETIANAYKQVEYDTEAASLAERHLELVKGRFELGKAGGVEFREAQLQLINARIRLATAKFQAKLALVELERMAGKIRVE